PTPHIYTLSLHDALPISHGRHALLQHHRRCGSGTHLHCRRQQGVCLYRASAHTYPNTNCDSETYADTESSPDAKASSNSAAWPRSEEHTSELQSRFDLVC